MNPLDFIDRPNHVADRIVQREALMRWSADLRTTDSPQGHGSLEQGGAFCCLGRAAIVAGFERTEFGRSVAYEDNFSELNTRVAPYWITPLGLSCFITMNDEQHLGFVEIAHVVDSIVDALGQEKW